MSQDSSRRRIAFDSKRFRNENKALRVLLVYKKSRLETYAHDQFDESEFAALNDEHKRHTDCLNFVHAALLKQGAVVEKCYRGDLSLAKVENRVIVTVGGDGTILDASHYSQNAPIFGVNSDPTRSVGSLCLATLETFDALFSNLMREELPLLPVARIAGTLNGKDLPILSLNEILVAHHNPAAMSRYIIEIDGKTEEHRSSGIWIAAAMGSTGATLSAGGQVRPLSDTQIQIVVREPYFAFGKVIKLLSGVLAPNATLKLKSRMSEGQIFFDGPHYVEKFGLGSELEIHSNGKPLLLFVTDEMEYRRSQMAHLRQKFHDDLVKDSHELIN